MAEKVFKSLQEFSDSYKTKRGTAFKADLSGFVAKDAEIHQAGAKWVVRHLLTYQVQLMKLTSV